MKAKRRIHKFNFDQETMKSGAKTHVALVDQAANLTEALVMKAQTITTRTQEVEEWDDKGNWHEQKDQVRIIDNGASEVRVIEEFYDIKAYDVRIR